jgi:hypothetical protein
VDLLVDLGQVVRAGDFQCALVWHPVCCRNGPVRCRNGRWGEPVGRERLARRVGEVCVVHGFHNRATFVLVMRSERMYYAAMYRSGSAAVTRVRSRRRATVYACDRRADYLTEYLTDYPVEYLADGADGNGGRERPGSSAPEPSVLAPAQDGGPPAGQAWAAELRPVDLAERVPVWDGPDVPSLAATEGVAGSRPAVLDPAAVRMTVIHDLDGGHRAEGVPVESDPVSTRPGLRDRVRALQADAQGLLAHVSDAGVSGGELGALVDLAAVADTIQTVMLGLTTTVEVGMVAQRRVGLPLTELLGLSTRMTHTERRGLVRTAADLEVMPGLAEAVTAGQIGVGEARAVLHATRRLDADDRHDIDRLFTDHDRLATQTVDDVLDDISARAVQFEERKADDVRVKAFERRFLAVQPGLDGTLSGYFEIDDASGAMLLAALDAAAPPITGDRALTRDAAQPIEQVPVDRRTLGRRRADALLTLAEHWLAGHEPGSDRLRDLDAPGDPARPDSVATGRGGPTRPTRARPLVYVWTDIDTLTGTDASGAAARLLWHTLGPNPVLTAAAVRRLADDARLQFILTSGDEILGVAAPVARIPAKVRAAVHARDQGCRFPGCRVPIHQTDLHHVVGRTKNGHTTVANLVAVCRRHHQAVTDARWRLDMDPTGRVTVRRGRHTASTDPPTKRRL